MIHAGTRTQVGLSLTDRLGGGVSVEQGPVKQAHELLRSQRIDVPSTGHNVWHTGTKEDADASYHAWKKLIPAGKLPPEPKKG